MKNKKLKKYADGTSDTGVQGMSSGMMGALKQIPGFLDAVIGLAENNPKAYSKQPTLSASTMKTMVSPYNNFALGGETEDVDMDEEQLSQLQQMADDNDISIEELIAQLQSKDNEEQMPEEESDLEDEGEVEEEFGYGGKIPKVGNVKLSKADIEVEGDEVIETPGGTIAQMKGPKHEEGGIDITVPKGTKIFSDRLKIGDKTMQERKIKRERAANRISKLLAKNPTDNILKNTVKRINDVNQMEEEQDMNIQKAVNAIANGEEFAYGGIVKEKKYGFGDEVPYSVDPPKKKKRFIIPQELLNTTTTPVVPGSAAEWHTDEDFEEGLNPNNPTFKPGVNSLTTDIPKKVEASSPDDSENLSAGDLIGLAGNLFNTVAPIINTNNNRRNTKPNINRFRGFGRKALEDNAQAEKLAAGLRTTELTDIDTAANTSYNKNRNSAMGVNTVRNLDIATELNKNKAKNNANNSFSKSMIGILGERSQLNNIKDKVEMSGEQQRDTEDKADTDNYYSNMAQNLVNAGTNVQGIGKSLNKVKSNRINKKLISQLSKYGLSFDGNGKLISI